MNVQLMITTKRTPRARKRILPAFQRFSSLPSSSKNTKLVFVKVGMMVTSGRVEIVVIRRKHVI